MEAALTDALNWLETGGGDVGSFLKKYLKKKIKSSYLLFHNISGIFYFPQFF